MNSIVEDILDLLQDKSDLSLPYRNVFVISSSSLFKMLSSVFSTTSVIKFKVTKGYYI